MSDVCVPTVFGTGLHKRSLGNNFDQRLKVTHSSFITTADNRFILAAGFWDKSFRVFSTESGKCLFIVIRAPYLIEKNMEYGNGDSLSGKTQGISKFIQKQGFADSKDGIYIFFQLFVKRNYFFFLVIKFNCLMSFDMK